MFVFADKGLHFIDFFPWGSLKFPWTCIVSLVHVFWLSVGFSQGLVLSILRYCFLFLRKPQMFYMEKLCFSSLHDFSERPGLVCNHNSCAILGAFYFLELRTQEKQSAFLKRIFFLFLFWVLCFFWSFEICSDFALVISPLKSLFSHGELKNVLWNYFFI